MGGGKSYFIMRHIMITERLFDSPYYDTIIFSSTSGSMDQTVKSLKKDVRSEVINVEDTNLLPFLKKHLRNKMKWYAVIEFITSKFEEVSDEMREILKKHRFTKIMRGKTVYDLKRLTEYALAKANRYHFTNYPSNTLLVMDDFAGNPLLKKVDGEIARMMTKTRHYNLTAIVCVQSWRFIAYNYKRLCTDIVIWKGFNEDDFKKMMMQVPNNKNWKELLERYKNLPSSHSKMIVHAKSDEVVFEE